MDKIQNICVLGLGYVGLTLGIAMAKQGFRVHGVEVNQQTVDSLNRGKPHFFEENLEEQLQETVNNNSFSVTATIPADKIDAFIICVGTPLLQDQFDPDLNFITSVISDISKKIEKGNLVLLRSTVPVGLTRKFVKEEIKKLSNLEAGQDYYLAYAPERTIEGKALQEINKMPQVIGGINNKSVEKAKEIFSKTTEKIVEVSSLETAELIKLLDNSYRDSRFAFANEVALICESLGVDANETIQAANKDYPRNDIAKPSPGVGGGCLTKDPWILSYATQKKGYKPSLIEEARKVNLKIPKLILERVEEKLKEKGKNLSKIKIFIAGFAFKGQPETDDLRESTTLWLLDELKGKVNKVYGFDPIVKKEDLEKLNIEVVSIEEGCENADLVMIMNNHKSFSELNPKDIIKKMNDKSVFFDAWRLFDKKEFENEKVTYMGVGFE